MGQITTETIAMIRRAVEANQAPPLTLWEFQQLAFLAEKQIARTTKEQLIDFAGDEPEERERDRLRIYVAIGRVMRKYGFSSADSKFIAEQVVDDLFTAKESP